MLTFTRDTHGTHGRTRAHRSHRRTSQPSNPTNSNRPPARQRVRDDRNRGRLNSRSPGAYPEPTAPRGRLRRGRPQRTRPCRHPLQVSQSTESQFEFRRGSPWKAQSQTHDVSGEITHRPIMTTDLIGLFYIFHASQTSGSDTCSYRTQTLIYRSPHRPICITVASQLITSCTPCLQVSLQGGRSCPCPWLCTCVCKEEPKSEWAEDKIEHSLHSSRLEQA